MAEEHSRWRYAPILLPFREHTEEEYINITEHGYIQTNRLYIFQWISSNVRTKDHISGNIIEINIFERNRISNVTVCFTAWFCVCKRDCHYAYKQINVYPVILEQIIYNLCLIEGSGRIYFEGTFWYCAGVHHHQTWTAEQAHNRVRTKLYLSHLIAALAILFVFALLF